MRPASLLVCLLLSSLAHASWTLATQAAAACAVGTQVCSGTFTDATVAGDVVIAFIGTGGSGASLDPMTALSDTAGSTYVIPSACQAFESTVALTTISCGYSLNVHAGATSITVTRGTTGGVGWQLRVLVFHSSVGNVALDGINAITDPNINTNPVGPTMTLTTAYNHVVVQALRGGGSAIALPYTMVSGWGTTTVGYAFNLNAAPAANWTQASGRAAMAAIAIAEGTTQRQPKVDVITENRFP